jgi:PAS domain S-box-containing protein
VTFQMKDRKTITRPRKTNVPTQLESGLLALLDTTDDLIWSVDSKHFSLLNCNRALAKFVFDQYGIKVHPGMRMHDVGPVEWAERWHTYYQKALDEGDFALDYEVLSRNKILNLAFHRLERKKRAFGVSVFARDVTDRKRIEAALRVSEENFAKMFRQSPVITTIESLVDDRFLDVNDSFESTTGFSREEAIGRTAYELGLFPNPEVRRKLVEQLKSCGRLRSAEFQASIKSGEVRTALVSAELIEINREPCIITASADITDQKHIENEYKKLAEALHELGGRLITSQEEERRRVARELHDDIGQEIALLSVRAQRIDSGGSALEGTVGEDVHELHKRIKEVAGKVSNLSHRLHSSELEFIGLSVATERICREFAKQHHVEVDYVVKDVPRFLGNGVALCFYRIIQESMQNVAKHSSARNLKLNLAVESGELKLAVRDDGQGFELEKPESKLGLGLISMRERMHLVGGVFSISSILGKGTTVCARVKLSAS